MKPVLKDFYCTDHIVEKPIILINTKQTSPTKEKGIGKFFDSSSEKYLSFCMLIGVIKEWMGSSHSNSVLASNMRNFDVIEEILNTNHCHK